MDTVFQPGLKIKATVRDGRVYAPGIGDDTRNIEALLATIRALDAAKIKTKGDLVFLFTTDEEAGMTGAKQYTKENKGKVDYYIALDGGYEGFTYAGIGINWYRHHFIGPGGHTRSRTPPYSATLPLARAIARIYELKVPTNPSSNLNIGMLGGSEVVNAKASDAWFTVDLRSTSNDVIADLEKKIAAILDEEAKRVGMTVKTDVISSSPAAVLPGNRESNLVKIAEAVHRAMGFDPPIGNAGSNNSSAALLQGITSISTGAGPCSDSHALTENCEIEPLYKGIKKILLLEIALAGLCAMKSVSNPSNQCPSPPIITNPVRRDDFQIEQQRPVLNVEQIEPHHLFKRQTISSGNLPQPRQPGLHVEPFAMPELIRFDFVRNRRPWSNNAHIAQQHVQKLRHFVETRAPQEFSNSRDTRIGEQFVSRLSTRCRGLLQRVRQ